MCARRFLIFIFLMILLFVAGAVAIFQFGQDILIRGATPSGHFEAPAKSGEPDYSRLDNWLARPTRDSSTNPAQWLPANVQPPTAEARKAAVFYIHPTTYLKRDRWNAPLDDDPDSGARTALFVRTQASAFNAVGDIWAPRYRQAAYGAFLLDNADSKSALDLAYRDVRSAFARFLKENPDRPIILVGHSQGALHLTRLLEEFGPKLKGRLVAAYVGGWPVSKTADLPAMGLGACTTAEQIGCVLSWQSFASPANPKLVLDAWVGTKGPTGVERERSDMLCVNPLTGTEGGRADASANPGILVPDADFTGASLEPNLVGAHCENGFLLIDGTPPAMGPFVMPGNNYHVYDYALWWAAIRKDAERRLSAWHR